MSRAHGPPTNFAQIWGSDAAYGTDRGPVRIQHTLEVDVFLIPDPKADKPEVESRNCCGARCLTMCCELRRRQVPLDSPRSPHRRTRQGISIHGRKPTDCRPRGAASTIVAFHNFVRLCETSAATIFPVLAQVRWPRTVAAGGCVQINPAPGTRTRGFGVEALADQTTQGRCPPTARRTPVACPPQARVMLGNVVGRERSARGAFRRRSSARCGASAN